MLASKFRIENILEQTEHISVKTLLRKFSITIMYYNPLSADSELVAKCLY